MRFLYGKVKARKGDIIRVKFSSPTRVLFLTEKEFNKYKNNISYTYYGGFKEESPFEFVSPMAARWHVVVEKGGTYFEPGDITASFELVTHVQSDNHIKNISEVGEEVEED